MRGWDNLATIRKAMAESGSDAVINGDEVVNGVPQPLSSQQEVTTSVKAIKAEKRKALSRAFETLWYQLGGPQLKPEHIFHNTRRWRIDFAIPEIKLFIEIDGGQWEKTGEQGKAHGHGHGMAQDYQKQNAAANMGWNVQRFCNSMIVGGDPSDIQATVDWANDELKKIQREEKGA